MFLKGCAREKVQRSGVRRGGTTRSALPRKSVASLHMVINTQQQVLCIAGVLQHHRFPLDQVWAHNHISVKLAKA